MHMSSICFGSENHYRNKKKVTQMSQNQEKKFKVTHGNDTFSSLFPQSPLFPRTKHKPKVKINERN